MAEAQEGSVRIEEVPHDSAPKVKRTYGKKKEPVDASNDTSSNIMASYRTRLEPPDNSGASDYLSSRSSFTSDASDAFGWKEKLALIDKQFDEEEQVATKFTRKLVANHAGESDSSGLSMSTEDDSSGLHDETLLSSSMPAPSSSQSDPPSPGPSEPQNTRIQTLLPGSDTSESMGISQVESLRLDSLQSRSTSSFVVVASESLSMSEEGYDFRSTARGASSDVRNDDEMQNNLFAAEQRSAPGKSHKGKSKERLSKIKKLSRREEKESRKAHARMMADQKVSITKRAEQYTVEHLLKSVRQGQLLSEGKRSVISSDPIQEFTSSPMVNAADASAELEPKTGPSELQPTSDDDMPGVNELLENNAEQRQREEEEAQRRKKLALAKKRALEAQKVQAASSDSGDDDLEVIVDARGGITKRTKNSTALEKKLANVARFRVGSTRHTLPEVLENSQTDRALKLAAKPGFGDRDARRTRLTVEHRDLQAAMLNKAAKQSMELTREKEEEWRRRGGKLAGKQRAILASEPLSLGHLAEALAQKKRSDKQSGNAPEMEHFPSDVDNSSDEEWQPREHGSMSPSSPRHPHDDEDELEGSICELLESNVDVLGELRDNKENEDEDSSQPIRQARRLTNRLVVSDSEDEEARPRRAKGRVLVPDTSLIIDDIGQGGSLSSDGPDEENKENDISLAVDSGDDKENAMLVQRAPIIRPTLGSRQPSRVFSLEDEARRLSISPSADIENEEPRSVRKPLQARKIGELDDPFVLRSPSSAASPRTPKSKRTLSAAASPVSLQPAFDGGFGGFTQLFNDDEGVHMEAPSTEILQPAFRLHMSPDAKKSRARSSLTPKLAGTDGSPETRPMFKKHPKDLPKEEELSLTLDTKLQPRLDITTQIRQRADVIFEKEQDFVMEEACTSATSTRSKKEFYVSENGLLTQTKPEASTPLLYRSWIQAQGREAPRPEAKSPPSTTQRLPLSTLSLSGEPISPSQQRLSRLKKGKARAGTSDDGGILASPLMDRPKDAFVRLLEGARREQKKDKRKLGKSHFVEGEAVESDEDELFGFGQPANKDDDEESDDDDPSAVVENLVDDRVMDDQELAEDKVLEKVKEQLEEEDATLEKYHQAAVEGKYRGKRRGGGIAMDDSESDEDEDEEARRLRRRMHKKRRIQGDKLEDLKKDEKSRAFYEAYQRDIQQEDNDDFAHLASDDIVGEDDSDGNEEPETVSTMEIMEQLREAARQQKGKERQFQSFDTEDLEWVHPASTSDEEFEVREIDERSKRTGPRRPVFGQTDLPDFDDSLPRKSNKLSEEQTAQLDAWRKEQSGRNLGTGGMRGAITVTGHGTKMANRGVGSTSRSASSRQQDNYQPVRRKITKTSSILASVSDKHSRFGL